MDLFLLEMRLHDLLVVEGKHTHYYKPAKSLANFLRQMINDDSVKHVPHMITAAFRAELEDGETYSDDVPTLFYRDLLKEVVNLAPLLNDNLTVAWKTVAYCLYQAAIYAEFSPKHGRGYGRPLSTDETNKPPAGAVEAIRSIIESVASSMTTPDTLLTECKAAFIREGGSESDLELRNHEFLLKCEAEGRPIKYAYFGIAHRTLKNQLGNKVHMCPTLSHIHIGDVTYLIDSNGQICEETSNWEPEATNDTRLLCRRVLECLPKPTYH